MYMTRRSLPFLFQCCFKLPLRLQECSIYLLDDILSAVDLKVARHILHHCINGLLRDKTRVLCTHQTQFLLRADSVVRMGEGLVIKQGQFMLPQTLYKSVVQILRVPVVQ